MNIAKIVSIKPDGKPWESQYGTMYPFYLVFDDHSTGTANSKTQQPAYKVGDMVGYEVSGASPKGVNKLKITRNPEPGAGRVTSPGPIDSSNPDLEAAPPTRPQTRPAPQSPSTAQGNPVHGATVGGALARAVDIWLTTKQPWNEDAARDVEIITRQLVAIQQRVESGAEMEELPPF